MALRSGLLAAAGSLGLAAAAYTCEPSELGVNACDRSVGPAGPSEAEYEQWRAALDGWADRRKLQLREEQPETGDFAAYDNPDIDWARTAYVQPQVRPRCVRRLSLASPVLTGSPAHRRPLRSP